MVKVKLQTGKKDQGVVNTLPEYDNYNKKNLLCNFCPPLLAKRVTAHILVMSYGHHCSDVLFIFSTDIKVYASTCCFLIPTEILLPGHNLKQLNKTIS